MKKFGNISDVLQAISVLATLKVVVNGKLILPLLRLNTYSVKDDILEAIISSDANILLKNVTDTDVNFRPSNI